MIPVTLANGTTVVLPYGEGTIPRAEVESFLARAGAMPTSSGNSAADRAERLRRQYFDTVNDTANAAGGVMEGLGRRGAEAARTFDDGVWELQNYLRNTPVRQMGPDALRAGQNFADEAVGAGQDILDRMANRGPDIRYSVSPRGDITAGSERSRTVENLYSSAVGAGRGVGNEFMAQAAPIVEHSAATLPGVANGVGRSGAEMFAGATEHMPGIGGIMQSIPGAASSALMGAAGISPAVLPALGGVFEGLMSSRNNQRGAAQPSATEFMPGTYDPAETIDIAGMLGTPLPGGARPPATASAAPAPTRSSEAASGGIDPRLMGGTGVFPEVEQAMRSGEPGGSNIYDPNFDPVAFYMNILGNEGSAQTDGEDEDFFLGQSRDELRRNLLNMGLGMMQAGGQPGAGFFDSLAYGGQTALAAEDRRRQRESSAQTAADQRRRDIAGELLAAVNEARDYRAGREDSVADREQAARDREIELARLNETIRSNNMTNDLGYFRANNAALNDSLERQLDMELFGIEPSATDTAMATHFMQNPETPQAQSWARRRASEIVRLARSGGIPSDMARSELDILARTFGRGIIEDLASGGG